MSKQFIQALRIIRNQVLLKAQEQVGKELQELREGDQPATSLAAAFAIGTSVSFIPLPFIDTLFIGLILSRWRQVNRAALLAARLLWNDLVVIPLYAPGFRLGASLLTSRVTDGSTTILWSTDPGTWLLSFALGIALVATAASAAAFILFFLAIAAYRARATLSRPFITSLHLALGHIARISAL